MHRILKKIVNSSECPNCKTKGGVIWIIECSFAGQSKIIYTCDNCRKAIKSGEKFEAGPLNRDINKLSPPSR